MGKDCELCNHSTFNFFTRPFLQCTRCGKYYHKQHYDDAESSIQLCPGRMIRQNKYIYFFFK